jgi:hypothetical protein
MIYHREQIIELLQNAQRRTPVFSIVRPIPRADASPSVER